MEEIKYFEEPQYFFTCKNEKCQEISEVYDPDFEKVLECEHCGAKYKNTGKKIMKNCLTCKFEPDWKEYEQFPEIFAGDCKWFDQNNIPIIISIDEGFKGVIRKKIDDTLIRNGSNDCGTWEAKNE